MAREKILIIDEAGFSRICSAILEAEGYQAATVNHGTPVHNLVSDDGVRLVVTSFPYGFPYFDDLCRFSLPVIVLTDYISRELISALEAFDNSICMIKPLDFEKFTSIVRQMMAGTFTSHGGYSIV